MAYIAVTQSFLSLESVTSKRMLSNSFSNSSLFSCGTSFNSFLTKTVNLLMYRNCVSVILSSAFFAAIHTVIRQVYHSHTAKSITFVWKNKKPEVKNKKE